MDFHLIILYRAERVNKEIKAFALAGRWFVEVCRIPRVLPWAEGLLSFQPVGGVLRVKSD